jgi:prevent-host-death family protein
VRRTKWETECAEPPYSACGLLGMPLEYHFMKTELVTSLKRKATDIIAQVTESRDPVLITQHGKPAAYLVDVETFEGLNQKLAILEGIGRGERAIEEGNTFTHREAKERLAKWLR